MLAPAACLVLLAGGTIAQETFAPTRSPTSAPTAPTAAAAPTIDLFTPGPVGRQCTNVSNTPHSGITGNPLGSLVSCKARCIALGPTCNAIQFNWIPRLGVYSCDTVVGPCSQTSAMDGWIIYFVRTVAPTPALTVPTVSPTVAPTAPTVSPTSAPASGSPTVSPTAVCTSQTLAGNPGADTGARAACPAEFPYLTQHSSYNYTVCYTTAYYATEGNRNPGCQTWCSLSGSTGGMCNRCFDNLPGYTRYSGRDCSGRNELTTTAGVSLQACADSCTAEQSCISFEHSTSHQNGQANVCQRSTSCVNELTTATSNGFSLS